MRRKPPMYKLKNLLRRIEAKRQLAKEEGLGFDAGLTLLEVAAAIGISVILALVIVLALTGLFSSAKHSTAVQTLTNVSTASQGYYGSNGGSYSGLTTTTVLSSQATGVNFEATKATGTEVTYKIGTSAAVFGTYDSGFGACLYVADVGSAGTTAVFGKGTATLDATLDAVVQGQGKPPAAGIWWGTAAPGNTKTCSAAPTGVKNWTSKVPTS